MRKRRNKYSRYIVIRTKELLLYQTFLGPVISSPHKIEQDVKRMYKKKGYIVTWISWSEATPYMRKEVKLNQHIKSND